MGSQSKPEQLNQEQAPPPASIPSIEAGTETPEEHPSDLFDSPEALGGKDKKFGSFNGVFRPTILTILGVMLYLREGWVVGNAGLVGAILVILACYVITGTTALSISSITTNIRVGSGGVFSIISQSLGLEVGGSVGIPLYLAQGLSAALYIQGIVETWIYLFPAHPRLGVTLTVFGISLLVSSFGAKLTFRVQGLVMLGTILALLSMFLGLKNHPINPSPVLWGTFQDGGFQVLFAVFFPAATGILVGSSLSGSLSNPRRSIPLGTLSAWVLSLLVFLAIAVWYSVLGSSQELRDTSRIFAVEKAFWGPLVLVGIMSSCFSATLSSLVAAPRVLQALASYRVVPFDGFFSKLSGDEPRNATLVTGLIVLFTLLLGGLNTIAQVLTMFFLVIYFMINLVLFIEHRMKMISFRPQFQIASWVPVVGALSCFIAILIINPLTGFLAIAFIIGIYFYLGSRHLKTPWETVQSGIFASIANWAAKKVITDENSAVKRSWSPDLLVSVERSTQFEGFYRLIRALTYPQGSVHVVGFLSQGKDHHFHELEPLIADLQQEGLFATAAYIESPDYESGMRSCISVKAGSFFKPNTLFADIEDRSEAELQALVDMARANELGVVFQAIHPESVMGRERSVNLWIRDQSPDWRLSLRMANLDYSVLISHQLKVNWKAQIRVLSVVKDEMYVPMTQTFLSRLLEYARMSRGVEVQVAHGGFMDFLSRAPRADINIFGLSAKVDKAFLTTLVTKARGSCLFVLDSGKESALA